jgi:hypothetical protein
LVVISITWPIAELEAWSLAAAAQLAPDAHVYGWGDTSGFFA